MSNESKYNPTIHHRHSIRLKGYDYTQAGLYFITICVQNRECLFGEIRHVEYGHSPKMILNDAGQMILKWYNELENKFSDIRCHGMIVMPNHFHCIIENVGSVRTAVTAATTVTTTTTVGADLRVCPNDIKTDECSNDVKTDECSNDIKTDECSNDIKTDECSNDVKTDECSNDVKTDECSNDVKTDKFGDNIKSGEHPDDLLGEQPNDLLGEHVGSPLHRVVQWFKTMTTNEYIRGVKTLGWRRFDGKLWQRNYYEHIIRNEQSYQRISEYIINNPEKWAQDKFYK